MTLQELEKIAIFLGPVCKIRHYPVFLPRDAYDKEFAFVEEIKLDPPNSITEFNGASCYATLLYAGTRFYFIDPADVFSEEHKERLNNMRNE